MKRVLSLTLAALLVLTSCGVKYYGTGIKKPRLPKPRLTEKKPVYTSDKTVTVDGVPLEALEIDGQTVIALEELEKCNFEANHRLDGEVFDMIAGCGYEHGENMLTPCAGGVYLGETEPSRDIVRINSVKIYNDFFGGKHYASVETLGELTDPYNEEWGYSDYNMKLTENGSEMCLECFRFPPVDYDGKLRRAEEMVDVAEAEIYTEGKPCEQVFYGGKNEPRAGIYAGIVGDGNGGAFKGDTPTFNHSFGVYSSYIEFDDMQKDIYYPNKRIVKENDCVMLVPWNVEDITLVFDDSYQSYIRKTLDRLKKYEKPVILRFAAEMNIGYLGDSPSAYVKAFRYIADIVHEYGFAVMWAPNDMNSLDRDYSYFYPGDEYVDWVGVSCFMRLDYLVQAPTSRSDAILFNFGDYAYHTNSLRYITAYMQANNIKKPLAVSEGGVLSLADYDGAPADFSVWAHERLGNMYWYIPMRYPQVKLITYFNHTSPGAPIGYWLKDKPDYIPIIEDALQNGTYLLDTSDTADFVFVGADGREYSESEIPIYTYLYIPGEGGHTVEYALDNEVISKHTQIPYKTVLHENGITEGRHTLSIIADGTTLREYTVTKSDKVIRID